MKFFELIDIQNLNTQLNALDIVSSAMKMELFELIESAPLTVSDIAEKVDSKFDTMVQLIDCLNTLGFVTVANGVVRLSDDWKDEYLSKETFSAFSLLKGALQSHKRWQSIPGIARQEGQAEQHEDKMFSSGENLTKYLQSVMDTNRGHAHELSTVIAEEIEQAGYSKVADVAGGHGCYLFEVLNHCPGITPTLMDLPATLNVFHALNETNPDKDKVTLLPIDLRKPLNDEIKYDVVMLNDLLHSFNRQDKTAIVRRLMDILHKDSLLMISKFDYGAHNLDLDWSLFSMNLHVNSTEGYLEKNEELEDILAECQMKIKRTVKIGQKISYFCQFK